jgi:hypothetical protein
MNRVLLTLLAVLTLWCGLSTWAVLHQRGKLATIVAELQQSREATKRALAAQKRADAALVSVRRKNAASDRAAASARASLAESLAAAPEWAQQPVPPAVQEALNAPL